MRASASASKSKRVAAQNRLFAALPDEVRRRLIARCEQVDLATATVLCEPGERIRHAFFPIDSFISLLTPANGEAPLEVGLVGDEGMMGAALMLGADTAPFQGLVQGAGRAWRMEAGSFQRELERSAALRRVLSLYLHVTLIQLAQSATCTRFHVVEARLARRLLMTRDRAHADKFLVTQQSLAGMLGVRRAGITRAATSLQRRNLIRYHRGQVSIVQGRGLEAASCVCYSAGKEAYRRIMG